MSNLFLTNTAMTISAATETVRHRLGPAAGAASTMRNKNTSAAPAAAVKITDASVAGTDGSSIAWYSDPLIPVTVAGQIVASLWCKESATTANVAASFGVYRCSATGVELATIVDPSTSNGSGEMGTTAGGSSLTVTISAANVLDATVAVGERLKVALFIDNAGDHAGTGSMISAQNAQFWVNGPTGAAGQSQVAFTEQILAVPGTAAGTPFIVGRQARRQSFTW